MKSRPAWRKGQILLQTLVMSIIMSMIAIMIMKWVLMRYVMVGHMHRSITANTRGEGYMFSQFCTTNWQTGAGVPNGTISLDSPAKSFSLTVVDGTANTPPIRKINMVTEQDQ